jgi:hypothetical protein
VKGRIEDGDLRDVRAESPLHHFDSLEFQPVVFGRELDQPGDLPLHLRTDPRGLAKGSSAMNDPVAHGINLRHAFDHFGRTLGQRLEQGTDYLLR